MIQIPNPLPLSKAANYAEKLALSIRGGEIIALTGNLGSGKTTFTQHFGKTLKVKATISSPTFILMQEFTTGTRLQSDPSKKLIMYHLDLYRTTSFAEVEALGITEWWGHPRTVTVIEWAEKITDHLPKKSIHIHLERDIGNEHN